VREDANLAKKLQEQEAKLSKSVRLKWHTPSKSKPPPSRWGHVATLIREDPPTLLITGGDAVDKAGKPLTLSESLLYNITKNEWTQASAIPTTHASSHMLADFAISHQTTKRNLSFEILAYGSVVNRL
jgi:hypothetical protein